MSQAPQETQGAFCSRRLAELSALWTSIWVKASHGARTVTPAAAGDCVLWPITTIAEVVYDVRAESVAPSVCLSGRTAAQLTP